MFAARGAKIFANAAICSVAAFWAASCCTRRAMIRVKVVSESQGRTPALLQWLHDLLQRKSRRYSSPSCRRCFARCPTVGANCLIGKRYGTREHSILRCRSLEGFTGEIQQGEITKALLSQDVQSNIAPASSEPYGVTTIRGTKATTSSQARAHGAAL
ncbi:hypothetical protein YC2023_018218 [Brassica napus]